MGYKTGRSRTLHASGTISGSFVVDRLAFDAGGGHISMGSEPALASMVDCQLSSNGMGAEWHITDFIHDGSGFWNVGASVSCHITAFGVSAAGGATNRFAFGPLPVTLSPVSLAVSGSYDMSIVVDEYVSITETGAFTALGGAPAEDPPFETRVTFYELPRLGQTVTCTITINGVTGTCSGTVTTQTPISYSLGGVINAYQQHGDGQPGTLSVAGTFLDAGVGAGYSRSLGGASASVSGLSATASVAGALGDRTASLGFNGGAPKSYALSGQIRNWNQAYSDALTVKIDRASNDGAHAFAATGSFSDSNTQHQYDAFCTLNGVAEGDVTLSPLSVSEYADLRCWIDPASLTALGEDPTDWRLQMRGWNFGDMALSQAASLIVDDGTALVISSGDYQGAWSGENGVAASSAGGEIVLACGNSTGAAKRTFTNPTTPGANFSGYRYLRIKIRASDDNQPFSLALGGKAWMQDYGGSSLVANMAPGTLTIDLCAQPAVTDAADTKWPLPTVGGPTWGVDGAKFLRLSGLVAQSTYYIDEIALCQHPSAGARKVTVLPAFKNWVQQNPDSAAGETTTQTFTRRFIQGDTDGRCSLEAGDYIKQILSTSGGDTTTYGAISIANTIHGINGPGNAALEPLPLNPGWSASGTTVASDPADGGNLSDWLNCNRPANYLRGAGALWSKLGADATFRWYYAMDLDASASVPMPAQVLFDVFSWYPGCTDPFGYTDAPSAGVSSIMAAKIMRGQAWGIVLDGSAVALSGKTVTLNRVSDGVQHGSGVTDSKGEYFTGSSFAREGVNYDTIAQVGAAPPPPYPKITRVMTGRYRWRADFSGIPPQVHPYNLQDKRGRYHATRDMGMDVLYWRSDSTVPTPGWAEEAVIIAHHASEARLDIDYRGLLYAVYTKSDGVYRSRSLDDGHTWGEEVMSIPQGRHPTNRVAENGTEIVAAYVAGAIQATVQHSGDPMPSSVYTFLDDSGAPLQVADDSFQIDKGREGPGRWLLHVRINGETDSSHWWSTDYGERWMRITS